MQEGEELSDRRRRYIGGKKGRGGRECCCTGRGGTLRPEVALCRRERSSQTAGAVI